MESRETLRLLQSRKSMRVYEKREVPEEVKREILSASIRAASAGNMALYTIIDITDEKLKQQLSVTCDHQPFITDAPLVLIYCADYRRWYRAFCEAVEEVRHPSYGDFMLAAEDAVIAAQTAATAADALGLGTCYIGDIRKIMKNTGGFFPCRTMWRPLPCWWEVIRRSSRKNADRRPVFLLTILSMKMGTIWKNPDGCPICCGKGTTGLTIMLSM